MPIVIILIVLALLFGVGGILLDMLWWMFVIAAVLFIAGLVTGGRGRRAP